MPVVAVVVAVVQDVVAGARAPAVVEVVAAGLAVAVVGGLIATNHSATCKVMVMS